MPFIKVVQNQFAVSKTLVAGGNPNMMQFHVCYKTDKFIVTVIAF